MSTNNPKAQFQLNNGNGWQIVAEVDIIDGAVNPPSAWTAARVMHKQIVYVGSTPVKTTVAPSDERTTHFAGFAKAVRQEEQNKVCGIGLHDWTPTKAEKVGRDAVAQRVYDLVVHILMHAPTSSLQHCCSRLEAESCIESIPDMPDLPEVQE